MLRSQIKNTFFSMTTEQIKEKALYGDYRTLAEMLGISIPAAKNRFYRGDQEAASAMLLIFKNRETLIKNYHAKKSS